MVGMCSLCTLYFEPSNSSQTTKQHAQSSLPLFESQFVKPSQARFELPRQRRLCFSFRSLQLRLSIYTPANCSCMIRDDSWPCDFRTTALATRPRATSITRRSCPEAILKHSSSSSGVRHVARPDQSVCAGAYCHQPRDNRSHRNGPRLTHRCPPVTATSPTDNPTLTILPIAINMAATQTSPRPTASAAPPAVPFCSMPTTIVAACSPRVPPTTTMTATP